MRIAFHRAKQFECIAGSAESQGLRFVEESGRRSGYGKIRKSIHSRLAICSPELKRICRTELYRAVRIGLAEEVERENLRRRLIETPTGYGNAGINGLQVAFKV